MSATSRPVRLAIVNDYEIVVAGISAILAGYPDRVEIVELDARVPVLADVDVILHDTFGQVRGDGVALERLDPGSSARVVIFSWNLERQLVTRALANGMAGYLSKALTGEQIVEAVERVRDGEIVVLTGADESSVGAEGDWPGRDVGLSPREAEVLSLIAQGLSNQEIADRAHLSINSIKTYIRSAYRKIGVDRRVAAVGWALHHGFDPDQARITARDLITADVSSVPTGV
jgi:DNA-binding NarL/FixJ family response regulator